MIECLASGYATRVNLAVYPIVFFVVKRSLLGNTQLPDNLFPAPGVTPAKLTQNQAICYILQSVIMLF